MGDEVFSGDVYIPLCDADTRFPWTSVNIDNDTTTKDRDAVNASRLIPMGPEYCSQEVSRSGLGTNDTVQPSVFLFFLPRHPSSKLPSPNSKLPSPNQQQFCCALRELQPKHTVLHTYHR